MAIGCSPSMGAALSALIGCVALHPYRLRSTDIGPWRNRPDKFVAAAAYRGRLAFSPGQCRATVGGVGTVTRPDRWHRHPTEAPESGGTAGAPAPSKAGAGHVLRPDTWILPAAIRAPIAVAARFIP